MKEKLYKVPLERTTEKKVIFSRLLALWPQKTVSGFTGSFLGNCPIGKNVVHW